MKIKNTKIAYGAYEYYELDSMAAYLEQQAAQGWELTSKTGTFLGFRRCKPKRVKISVELVYANDRDDDREEYAAYCKEAGWERIFSDGKIQIFENQDLTAEPINTDPETKLKTIHKKCSKINIYTNLIAVVLYLYVWYKMAIPKSYFDYVSSINWAAFIIFPILVLLLIGNTATYLFWYRKAKQLVAKGQHPLYIRNRFRRAMGAFGLGLCYLCIWGGLIMEGLYQQDKRYLTYFSVLIGIVVLGMLVLWFFSARRDKDRQSHWGRYIGFILVLTLASIPVSGTLSGTHAKTITVEGESVQVYDDDMALTMEDLGIKTTKYQSHFAEGNGSPILQYSNGIDTSANEKGYSLEYYRYTTRNPKAYQSVIDYFRSFSELEEISEPAFGADKVYRMDNGHLFILYPQVIFELITDIPLNDGQKTIIGKKLGN